MESPWMRRAVFALIVGMVMADVYVWWGSTDEGRATVARWRDKAKAKAEGCGGCAKRKAALRRAVNRVHWDAERIVEGEDVETVRDPVIET